MHDLSNNLKLAFYPSLCTDTSRILADLMLIDTTVLIMGWPSFLIVVCAQDPINEWLQQQPHDMDASVLYANLDPEMLAPCVLSAWNLNPNMLMPIPIISQDSP